jgi:hypothetical protein
LVEDHVQLCLDVTAAAVIVVVVVGGGGVTVSAEVSKTVHFYYWLMILFNWVTSF